MLTQNGKGLQRMGGLETDAFGNLYTATAISTRDTTYIQGKDVKIAHAPMRGKGGWSNVLLSKYNKAGEVLWTNLIVGKETVYPWSTHISEDGSFYVGGNFKNDALFHSSDGDSVYIEFQLPKDYAKQFLRFFIAKYNSDGVLLWVRTGHSWDNMSCFDILSDGKGNAYAWVYTPSSRFTIGDFSIYPSSSSKNYIERHYACLIKYSEYGEEQWISFTGDEVTPRDLDIIDDKLVLVGTQAGKEAVIKSTSGEEWLVPKPEKPYYLDRLYYFDLEDGKYLGNQNLSPDVGEANLDQFRKTNDGYLVAYEGRYYSGIGNIIRIKDDTIVAETPLQREPDLYVVKLGTDFKYQWHVSIDSRARSVIQDMIQLDNGDIFLGIQSREKASIIDAKGKEIPFKNEVYNHLELVHLNDKGKYLDQAYVGRAESGTYDKTLHFSTGNGMDLNIASSLSISSKIFGNKISVHPKDPNRPERGGYEDGLLIHLPAQSKFQVDLFITEKELIAGMIYLRRAVYELGQDIDRSLSELQRQSKAIKDSLDQQLLTNRNEQSITINRVFIYPNPVRSQKPSFKVNLDVEGNRRPEFELISSNGKILFRKKAESNSGTFSFEFPPEATPGLYFLRVFIGEKVITKKIIYN